MVLSCLSVTSFFCTIVVAVISGKANRTCLGIPHKIYADKCSNSIPASHSHYFFLFCGNYILDFLYEFVVDFLHFVFCVLFGIFGHTVF